MKEIINVPIPNYPGPFIPSPIATAFNEEESVWYETDYSFMGPESVKRDKKQNIVQVALYMFPTITSMDQCRPIARFLVYETLFDDYVELMPLTELATFRDRVFEVMMEQNPAPGEIGILHQMAYARKEWLANGMPQFWIERISTNFYKFVTYGIMEETPFKFSGTYPSLSRFLLIGPYSIGMVPYGDLLEPAMGVALPDHIYNHPIIQRLMILHSTILAIQNDYASIRKEMTKEKEIFNIMFVLQHEYKISLEEVFIEGPRIHDELVKELESLSICLPDFSPYQKEAETYVYNIN